MDDSDKKQVHVQPVSRDNRFTKFRSMECFAQVHQHILDGWTPMEVAKFIQDESQEYLDVTRPSLINTIKAYRATIPPAELVSKRMPVAMNKAAKKLQEGIDEVAELEWLTRFQKRRLRIDGETEKKINKLLPTMTQEVRAQVEVLRTLASVKMDLGLNKRSLGSIEVNATMVAGVVDKYGTSSVAKVLQDSASRQKVMSIAEKFLALANHIPHAEAEALSGNVIDATVVPTPVGVEAAAQVVAETAAEVATDVDATLTSSTEAVTPAIEGALNDSE